jgi:hypothetical protein
MTEVYEIPVDENKFEDIKDLYLTRISDIDNTYAMMIDWCSCKEVFIINF